MLMAVSVKKRGVFLIGGILMAAMGLISGHIYSMIGNLIGGVLAELVAGKYISRKRIYAAYIAFATGGFCGVYIPAFMLGTNYLLSRGGRFGITAEMLQEFSKFFSVPSFLMILGLNAIGALLGAFIGSKILKKHFQKAGLVS